MAMTETLLPGLADPVLDAQKIFRAVLEAMARPGTVVDLPYPPASPEPLDAATTAIALALADQETVVWLDDAADSEAVRQHLRFHCGSPLTADPAQAHFAIVADIRAMPPLSAFNLGGDEYPDRSTTLILQVPDLTGGAAWTLGGPGIRERATLAIAGLPDGFRDQVIENHLGFPRGVDLIFTCGARATALPRSTRLEG
jgi:alpha-D-ribose 1-methylphosphonate 5-triphosphate synthase subunit PhnH